LLPPPSSDEPAHNADVHPLKTSYKRFIEVALRKWQDDVATGRESKKWRDEAIQASHDHSTGKWDDLRSLQRQIYWATSDPITPGNGNVGLRNETAKTTSSHERDEMEEDDDVA
jgi:hypothetical protein